MMQRYGAHLLGQKQTVFNVVALVDMMTIQFNQWGMKDVQILGAASPANDGSGAFDVFLQAYRMSKKAMGAKVPAYIVNADGKGFKNYLQTAAKSKTQIKRNPAFMFVPEGLFGKKNSKKVVILWMLPPKGQENVKLTSAQKKSIHKQKQSPKLRRFVPFVASHDATTSSLGTIRVSLGAFGALTPSDAYRVAIISSNETSRLFGMDSRFAHTFSNKAKTTAVAKFSSIHTNDPSFRFNDNNAVPAESGRQLTAGSIADVGIVQHLQKLWKTKYQSTLSLGARFPKSKADPSVTNIPQLVSTSERRPYLYLTALGQANVLTAHHLALRGELDQGADLLGFAKEVSPAGVTNPKSPATSYLTKRLSLTDLYAPKSKRWGILTALRWHHAQGNSPFAQYFMYTEGPYANSGFLGLRAETASVQFIHRMPDRPSWRHSMWAIKGGYGSVHNPDRVWINEADKKPGYVEVTVKSQFQQMLNLSLSLARQLGSEPSNSDRDYFVGVKLSLRPDTLLKRGY